jgi:hypothetical protein
MDLDTFWDRCRYPNPKHHAAAFDDYMHPVFGQNSLFGWFISMFK